MSREAIEIGDQPMDMSSFGLLPCETTWLPEVATGSRPYGPKPNNPRPRSARAQAEGVGCRKSLGWCGAAALAATAAEESDENLDQRTKLFE